MAPSPQRGPQVQSARHAPLHAGSEAPSHSSVGWFTTLSPHTGGAGSVVVVDVVVDVLVVEDVLLVVELVEVEVVVVGPPRTARMESPTPFSLIPPSSPKWAIHAAVGSPAAVVADQYPGTMLVGSKIGDVQGLTVPQPGMESSRMLSHSPEPPSGSASGIRQSECPAKLDELRATSHSQIVVKAPSPALFVSQVPSRSPHSPHPVAPPV